MNTCNFELPFTSDINELLTLAREQAAKHEAEFSGDANQGDFQIDSKFGKFSGSYTISGQTIFLELKKPMMLPCSMIEPVLKNYIK